jgi:hypothetical protein
VIVTLVRPVTWAVGLAGLLAGGGVVLVALPVLALPTPTGLQNALGGPVSSLVFGAPSTALVTLILGAFAGGIVLVLAGVAIGAWAERAGIGIALEAAADEGIAADAALDGAPGWWPVATVRLLSLLPVVLAVVLAWRPVYDAAYRELVLPGDLVVLLPVRVAAAVPGSIALIAVTWLLADAAAAVGVRRLVLDRATPFRAWLRGWTDLVRRPQRILPTSIVGLLVLLLLAGPALVASAIAWRQVRGLLLDGRDPVAIALATLVWVAVWLAGLVLAGVGAAFRNAAWTLELPRGDPAIPTRARAPGQAALDAPSDAPSPT